MFSAYHECLNEGFPETFYTVLAILSVKVQLQLRKINWVWFDTCGEYEYQDIHETDYGQLEKC